MKDYNIKEKSNNNGITLIALVITVAVMLLLAVVTIEVGTETLDNTRLQGFYSQLRVIQKRVDEIVITNEKYVDSKGNTIDIKEQGTPYNAMTVEQKNIIQNEISELGIVTTSFKYFTIQQLEEILGLKDMEYNVFIDFNSRTIIAEEGITVNGKVYRLLNDTTYYVNENPDKNKGTISLLEFKITTYGKEYYGNTIDATTDRYKITVTPSNTVGDLQPGGTIKYKKTTSKYWETSDNLEMIVSELTLYDVTYEDNNKNSVSETIRVYIEDNVPKVEVYNYS